MKIPQSVQNLAELSKHLDRLNTSAEVDQYFQQMDEMAASLRKIDLALRYFKWIPFFRSSLKRKFAKLSGDAIAFIRVTAQAEKWNEVAALTKEFPLANGPLLELLSAMINLRITIHSDEAMLRQLHGTPEYAPYRMQLISNSQSSMHLLHKVAGRECCPFVVRVAMDALSDRN
jgi:hypothetical protein